MDKIVEFWKSKYKILIPIMVVFVLLITVYFLYREYKYDNYRNRHEELVYQYFGGMKTEYTGIITYNLKDVIVDVSAKDKKIDYDSTPIYYSKNKKVIFPDEMNVVFPLRDGSQFKIYKYSIYEKDENSNFIKSGEVRDEYSHFILFDGKSLFAAFHRKRFLAFRQKSQKRFVEIIQGFLPQFCRDSVICARDCACNRP